MEKAKNQIRFPIWAKTLIALATTVLLVGGIAVAFSSTILINVTRSHYIEQSTQLADTLGIYLDKEDIKSVKNAVKSIYDTVPEEEKISNSNGWGTDEYNTYLAHYEPVTQMAEYQRLFDSIALFHEKNDAKYTVLGYADLEDKRFVYLVDDSPIDDRCLPGSFDDFSKSDMAILDHIEEGFPPEITNMEEYGYIVSVSRPIYDGTDIIAFAMVDLSMDAIRAQEQHEVAVLAGTLGGVAAIAITIGFLLVLFLFIRPIRKLTHVANEYTNGAQERFDKFGQINIHTRDELEDLTDAMKKMENDINHYIGDIVVAENKAEQMKQIADIDALTGLGNKRAYYAEEEAINQKIKGGTAHFAVAMVDLNGLKEVNDAFGHDKGDELIASAAKKIRENFADSRLFRIGGDEFVVVSEGEEIARFEKQVAAFLSDRKDGVSAALGYAIFNPKRDNNFEDTFKRADRAMYENKKSMKASD